MRGVSFAGVTFKTRHNAYGAKRVVHLAAWLTAHALFSERDALTPSLPRAVRDNTLRAATTAYEAFVLLTRSIAYARGAKSRLAFSWRQQAL